MLIRSQDKSRLISLNNTRELRFWECAQGFNITDCVCPIGHYSTREKAMKVLDMIQEAYMDYKSGEIIGSGLAGSAYTGSYDTKESVAHGIAVLKGYGNEIRKSILFQMPADSEVVA